MYKVVSNHVDRFLMGLHPLWILEPLSKSSYHPVYYTMQGEILLLVGSGHEHLRMSWFACRVFVKETLSSRRLYIPRLNGVVEGKNTPIVAVVKELYFSFDFAL